MPVASRVGMSKCCGIRDTLQLRRRIARKAETVLKRPITSVGDWLIRANIVTNSSKISVALKL